MSGGGFNHISPGSIWQPSAVEINAMKDAARAFQAAAVPSAVKPAQLGLPTNPICVRVKNNTGADVDRYTVHSLGEPRWTIDNSGFTPADCIWALQDYDATKPPAVAIEPIKSNEVGLVAVSGPVLAKITGDGTADDRVAAPNASGVLVPGSGSVAIAHSRPSGGGYVLVILGGGGSAAGAVRPFALMEDAKANLVWARRKAYSANGTLADYSPDQFFLLQVEAIRDPYYAKSGYTGICSRDEGGAVYVFVTGACLASSGQTSANMQVPLADTADFIYQATQGSAFSLVFNHNGMSSGSIAISNQPAGISVSATSTEVTVSGTPTEYGEFLCLLSGTSSAASIAVNRAFALRVLPS